MSRHKARQEALELLYSREFHEENDIQYHEHEIMESDFITTDMLTEDGPELSESERHRTASTSSKRRRPIALNWTTSSVPSSKAGKLNG